MQLLGPVLDDRGRGVDDGAVHVEEESIKGHLLGWKSVLRRGSHFGVENLSTWNQGLLVEGCRDEMKGGIAGKTRPLARG